MGRGLVALSVFAAAVACSDGDSGTGPGPSPGPNRGLLTVQMHDDPFNDAEAVLITFSEVTAHRSGAGGFERLPFADGGATRTCDLKKLVDGHDEILGTGPLPAGHYTQLRLLIVDARLYFDNKTSPPACAANHPIPNGRSRNVQIPSGEVRLNREFDVAEGATTTITLDFDGEKSIRSTSTAGAYVLQPVIRVVSIQGP
ncbi:MAG TPA: DUF4382 domain-containing protein [Vicinamibacteria bacterium]|nr:DUF4382 domain-containing protein [Vicinamibacteria bacterium]